jgi:hypothetical protein
VSPRSRAPVGAGAPEGRGVEVDDPDEDLRDDPPADRAERLAAAHDVGLLEHVVPERRLGVPAVLAHRDLLGRQDALAEVARDVLAARQAGAEPALEVPDGERLVLGCRELAGDGGGQADERRHQPPVDELRALRRRRRAREVEEHPPVGRALGRDRTEAHEPREEPHRLHRRVEPVALADLAVAVAERRVGELDGDERRAARAEQAPAAVTHRRRLLRGSPSSARPSLLRGTSWPSSRSFAGSSRSTKYGRSDGPVP